MNSSASDQAKNLLFLWCGLFIAGLLFRLYFLSHYGMQDMDSYIKWGQRVSTEGIADAYTGIYFPLQWQLFHCATSMADTLGISANISIKLMNLFFELAVFLLLMVMLKQSDKPRAFALVFWCHPWFISNAILGYIDIQYSFFILLTVYLAERSRTFFHYLAAGIPLALAFLMKPQVEVLILSGALYIALNIALRKEWKPLGLTIAPAVLFIGYSLYFFTQGQPVGALFDSYIHISDIMPSICAQMLNVWYPLAYLLTEEGRAVYSESDLQTLIGPLFIRHAAIAVTVTYLAYHAYRLVRRTCHNDDLKFPWLQLLAYSALALPMLMTSAHENHGFLASILLLLLLTIQPSRIHLIALHLFMLLQTINLLGLYGVGLNRLTHTYLQGAMAYWTPETMLISSSLIFMAYLMLLQYFYRHTQPAEPDSPWYRSQIPSILLVLIFTGIYTLSLHSN